MKKINLSKITTKGKAIYLAYDQGLEHGPEHDFNDININPEYIIEIAKNGKYNGIILHKGIAEKYYKEIKKSKVPLIIKLNGKTKLVKGEPMSSLICTVDEAIKLGAVAVGYTIYLGSEHEEEIIEEFSSLVKKAHSKGIPIIAWIYPRGKAVKNDVSREMMAYSARVGLEIGADMIKMKYGGNKRNLSWAVESAGRTKIVISGGKKVSEKKFLKELEETMTCGAIGMAVGRNVWQNPNPLELTKKMKEIIWKR